MDNNNPGIKAICFKSNGTRYFFVNLEGKWLSLNVDWGTHQVISYEICELEYLTPEIPTPVKVLIQQIEKKKKIKLIK